MRLITSTQRQDVDILLHDNMIAKTKKFEQKFFPISKLSHLFKGYSHSQLIICKIESVLKQIIASNNISNKIHLSNI